MSFSNSKNLQNPSHNFGIFPPRFVLVTSSEVALTEVAEVVVQFGVVLFCRFHFTFFAFCLFFCFVLTFAHFEVEFETLPVVDALVMVAAVDE